MLPVWDDPTQLERINSALQWSAIPLIVLGVLLQIGQLVIDKREKSLTAQIEADNEKARLERETKFQDRLNAREKEVAQLKIEATDLRTSTEGLKSHAETLKPFRQPISFGSAMIQVFTATRDEKLTGVGEGIILHSNTLNGTAVVLKFLDSHDNALLGLSTTEAELGILKPVGMEARSLLAVTPNEPGYGSYIDRLGTATKVSIDFVGLKSGDKVLGGRVNINISNVINFDLAIPEQVMAKTTLLINDLSPMHRQIAAHRR